MKTEMKMTFVVGSSIFREVRDSDIVNGSVKCVHGGTIETIKSDLMNLKKNPKAIITQVGGNDLCEKETSVSNDYATLVAETKTKFPNARLIVSGHPPRFPDEETRCKVKDFNQVTKDWCRVNDMLFMDNNDCFELQNGEVDTSCFVLTGDMPNIHLNRRGTTRLLENLQKNVPQLKLSDQLHQSKTRNLQKARNMDFAGAVKRKHNVLTNRYTKESVSKEATKNSGYSRGCYFCGEPNHNFRSCKYRHKIRSH